MSKEPFDHQAGLDWYNQLIIDCNTADERLADAVETMRAKCEGIARKVGDAAEKGRLANYKKGEEEWRFSAASEAASEIEEAIAALKGNGEGK